MQTHSHTRVQSVTRIHVCINSHTCTPTCKWKLNYCLLYIVYLILHIFAIRFLLYILFILLSLLSSLLLFIIVIIINLVSTFRLCVLKQVCGTSSSWEFRLEATFTAGSRAEIAFSVIFFALVDIFRNSCN